MDLEELLKVLRRDGTNKPLQSILEQQIALRDPKPSRKPSKRRKQDKRTTRKKFYEWRRERADELREYNNGLRQMFFHMRREVIRRGKKQAQNGEPVTWAWNLTIGEWVNMWLSCPAILVGQNVYKPAWKMRGPSSTNDVRLNRIDTSKPFEINNLEIRLGNKVLYPTSNT